MGDDVSTHRSKFQFKPKAPLRKTPKAVAPKSEKPESSDAVLSDELLKLVKQTQEEAGNRKGRVERRVAPVRVAFGYGQSLSKSRQMRYGAASGFKHLSTDGGGMETAALEEYEEPFNYQSYYPTRLPLRRPYSGDPELLDESEFGEASASNIYDEHSINTAAELGLMNQEGTDGEGEKGQMFFFQLPATLPLSKQFTTSDSNEEHGSDTRSQTTCNLAGLQAGFLGKMMIYEDCTITMKVGDMLFDGFVVPLFPDQPVGYTKGDMVDASVWTEISSHPITSITAKELVSASSECTFAQDVCVVETEGKEFCNLGELTKRAIVTPNIDSMLDVKIEGS